MSSQTGKKKQIKGVRGVPTVSGEDCLFLNEIETTIETISNSYCFEEIRLPVIEHTELFNRTIGDSTDIVNKEMYTFPDKKGESLTLRPEGTASCVRYIIESNLIVQTPLRLRYQGPMFRYERPQKGRQRQFNQVGFETFGMKSVFNEVELLVMIEKIFERLEVKDLTLEINCLGSENDRTRYADELDIYFQEKAHLLSDSQKETLNKNPLRLLDSKDPKLKEILHAAPTINNYISESSARNFDIFKDLLNAIDVDYKENNKLVRGLDYYSDLVFEWTTTNLGAQSAVCAGGRYDNLVEKMGGKPTAALGCAIGLERLLELYKIKNQLAEKVNDKIYLIATEEKYSNEVFLFSQKLRKLFGNLKIEFHSSEGSLKSKMKKADKSGASIALLIGEEEINNNVVTFKDLRNKKSQETLSRHEVLDKLKKFGVNNKQEQQGD